MTDRDDIEVDALVTDRYLESLLAARDRRSAAAPADPDVTPSVQAAAVALEAHLVRVHPSFRFEERLAADLQGAAVRLRRGGRAARSVPVARVPVRQPDLTRAPQSASRPAADRPGLRPLLIGGALTSAAISIAGVYVAWRRGRPPVDPMVRAVRAAHRSASSRGVPARAARATLRSTRTR
jgi:hypothetical protein